MARRDFYGGLAEAAIGGGDGAGACADAVGFEKVPVGDGDIDLITVELDAAAPLEAVHDAGVGFAVDCRLDIGIADIVTNTNATNRADIPAAAIGLAGGDADMDIMAGIGSGGGCCEKRTAESRRYGDGADG